ncbi:hypothetical protein BJ741DRAFT_1789 [Chytriomyces cf. hyalinus JEL632]|nr:hypothetical protein BJ741DRAFT_1789 [Chytriomyces cf. hyalinus JEL632]
MSYRRVYVGKLPRDVTEREVRRHFDEFGRIREVRILVGFAFVEYESSRDARDAVDKLDNSRFLGERIIVEPSKVQRDDRRRGDDRGDRSEPRQARGSGKNRLKVENLPSRMSWQNLKDLMRKAGEVSFTDIDRDGNGIVEFSNPADMEEAIKMFDDTEYEGKRLIVKEDQTSERGDTRGDRDDRRSSRRDDDRRDSRRSDDRSDRRHRRDDRSVSPERRRSRDRSESPARSKDRAVDEEARQSPRERDNDIVDQENGNERSPRDERDD